MANIFTRTIASLFNAEVYPSIEEYDVAYNKLADNYIAKSDELERAYDTIETLLAEVDELESGEAVSDELFSEMTDIIAELDADNDKLMDYADSLEDVLQYIGAVALISSGSEVEVAE